MKFLSIFFIFTACVIQLQVEGFCDDIYHGQVYQHPNYGRIMIAPPEHHVLLNYGGRQITRNDIDAKVDGRQMKVPIINGYAPLISVQKFTDGSSKYTFDYKARKRWNGGNVWSRPSKKPKTVNRDVVVEPIPGINASEENPFSRDEREFNHGNFGHQQPQDSRSHEETHSHQHDQNSTVPAPFERPGNTVPFSPQGQETSFGVSPFLRKPSDIR